LGGKKNATNARKGMEQEEKKKCENGKKEFENWGVGSVQFGPSSVSLKVGWVGKGIRGKSQGRPGDRRANKRDTNDLTHGPPGKAVKNEGETGTR